MLLCTPSLTAAQPPSAPAHGIPPETFYALWSGDVDTDSPPDYSHLGDAESIATLAAVTDLSFDQPPKAVEQWNRGDHREFPGTGIESSRYPDGATLRNGTVIRDAHATIFAIQPSTRLLASPTDQPLYVAPTGEVLGVVDYRVELPADMVRNGRQVSWHLRGHHIEAISLLVDGTPVTTTEGSQTPRLRFDALETFPGDQHTLTLEATIVVDLASQIECGTVGPTNQTGQPVSAEPCSTTATLTSEWLTVRDSIEVVVYDPAVSGVTVTYPHGETGLALTTSLPWAGYATGEGTVQGTWRFYSARDPRWDRLTTASKGSVSTAASPLVPLQVYAYPAAGGVRASDDLTVLEVVGMDRDAPVLPEYVDVPIAVESYYESTTIVTRGEPESSLLFYGLVRGTDVEVDRSRLTERALHETTLTLTIVDRTDEAITIEVALTDAETGDPIDTRDRADHVVVAGHEVDTDAKGQTTLTLVRPAGALTARYDPTPWWDTTHEQAYLPSTDTVYIRGTTIPVVASLFQFAVPVGSLLFALYLIDRLTGWGAWPPWRGL